MIGLFRSCTLLVLLLIGAIHFSTSQSLAASDKDIWLSSRRGKADLDKLPNPNLVIGLQRAEVRDQLAKILTIEESNIFVATQPSDIELHWQTVDAKSRFSFRLDRTQTGLPNDLTVGGTVAFSVAITFSGSAFHFLPHVGELTISSVQGGTLPDPIRIRIPEWLQDAVRAYLQARDILQLPVQLAQDLSLSTDAASTGQTPGSAVTLSKSAARAEIWVNGAAALIDENGILGLAEVHYDITIPACSAVMASPPSLTDLRFTEYDSDRVISEIGSKTSAVVVRGKVNPVTRVDYEVVWRLNGVTLSSSLLSPGGSGEFSLPLATVPKGYGLYSVVVTARHTKVDSEDREIPLCAAGSRDIVKLQELDLATPDPLTHDAAIVEYRSYFQRFKQLMDTNAIPFALGDLYLAVSKPTIADILIRAFNGFDVSATVDGSKLPQQHVRGANIKVPPPDTISCSPTRDCSPTRICTLRDCPFDEDQRSCHRDTFWGGYNDPFCESLKAATNAGRRAAQARCIVLAAGEKLDCERLKTQERTTCELEKATERTVCEGIKGVITLMTPDGNLATVNGDFSFSGTASSSLVRFNIAKQLDQFSMAVRFGGHINAHVVIEFIPQNVGGHVVGCISKWKEAVDLSAGLTSNPIALNGGILFRGDSRIALDVQVPKIDVKFTPPIPALFANNPHLVALCPVLFGAGVGAGIYSLLDPSFRNTLITGDYSVDPMKVNFSTRIPNLEIPARFGWPSLSLRMQEEGTSLVWH